MDVLAAEVDRVVFTPYPTQLKVGHTTVNVFLCYGIILMITTPYSLFIISFLEHLRPTYVYGLLAITVAFPL
jgi:hypothetical protein